MNSTQRPTHGIKKRLEIAVDSSREFTQTENKIENFDNDHEEENALKERARRVFHNKWVANNHTQPFARITLDDAKDRHQPVINTPKRDHLGSAPNMKYGSNSPGNRLTI